MILFSILDWSGIYFNSTASSSLKFVNIAYMFSGIAVDNTNISIADTTLSESAGVVVFAGNLTLKNFKEENIYDLGIKALIDIELQSTEKIKQTKEEHITHNIIKHKYVMENISTDKTCD